MANFAAERESVPGFEAPVHRSLAEPILMGGAPRSVAILNGTIAAALGLGLRLWIAGLLLPLAVLIYFVIPPDASYHAFDDTGPEHAAGSWSEMLERRWRWMTIGCVLLSGIDFNAYQLFFSFVTLYLKQVRLASAAEMGLVIAVISAGSLIGTFAWAAVADRFGRRAPLTGYLLCGAAILVFLYAGLSSSALVVPGFVFGFGLSCTTAWGVWFAEMFPQHLRPYGVALFQAGTYPFNRRTIVRRLRQREHRARRSDESGAADLPRRRRALGAPARNPRPAGDHLISH